MRNSASRILFSAAIFAMTLWLTACDPPPSPNDLPLTHWLNEKEFDGCTRQTAKAILESGRPWPNEIRDDKGNLKRIDLWLGNQLYEMPISPGGPSVLTVHHNATPSNTRLLAMPRS
jgi:hypothetical protein